MQTKIDEREVICDLIRSFGITSKYNGYYYVVECISMYVHNDDLMITKDVYPTVAKKFGCNARSVEHCIRTVINHCWKNNRDLLTEIANYPLSKRPTSIEFIDILAYYVSKQLNYHR